MLDSNKAGVRFHTDQLTKYNNEYLEIKKNYETIQEKIVAELLSQAGKFFHLLSHFQNPILFFS